MRLLRRDAAPVAGVCRQVPAALLRLPREVVRIGMADPMGAVAFHHPQVRPPDQRPVESPGTVRRLLWLVAHRPQSSRQRAPARAAGRD